MNNADPAIAQVRERLAKGEIDEAEYLRLMSILEEPVKATDAGGSNAQRPTLGAPPLELLTAIDGLRLFNHFLEWNGRRYEWDDIVTVGGNASSMSVNFIPMEKSSDAYVKFANGDEISFKLSKAFFAGKRHEEIRRAQMVLRAMTKRSRAIYACEELDAKGSMFVGIVSDPIKFVTMSADGFVLCDDEKISIRRARSEGTFVIGTVTTSFSGRSSSTNPGEIVISEKKVKTSGLFAFRGALRFNLASSLEDIFDLICSRYDMP